MPEVDVLIVGAGPTGLMLAHELALQNVSFRIVEKAVTRSPHSRALVVHSRSLELLHRHGITQELIARGRFNKGARVCVNGAVVTQIDAYIGAQDTSFPEMLFVSQADTERCLEEALEKKRGLRVERGVEVREIEQDESGVLVGLNRDGDEEHVKVKYVVGCDGAHSVVRRAAGMTFEGGAYAQSFITADVQLEKRVDRVGIFMGKGVLVIFPLNDEGFVRLVVTRPEDKPTDLEEPSLDDFQEVYDLMVDKTLSGKLYDPTWMARFRLHQRIVDSYRKGRLFVAGDAAHIHSPAGGQGMNTGIQDAANLGWKLGQVLRDEDGDELLDSYHTERHPIGEMLLRSTDRMFRVASTTNPIFLFLRNLIMPWLIPWVMNNDQRRQDAFRFLSQLGIRYRSSPIVGTASSWKGALRGGDRAPDGEIVNAVLGTTALLSLCTGTSHHLLLFSGAGLNKADATILQNAAAGFQKRENSIEVHNIFTLDGSAGNYENVDEGGSLHQRYGFVEPGYVLVRPDGHVAHIGSLAAINELEAFLKKE
jgi:2-polyprenyl-6-methoxyphenol hydroxylase-like FAD-dependent oxidoreductase